MSFSKPSLHRLVNLGILLGLCAIVGIGYMLTRGPDPAPTTTAAPTNEAARLQQTLSPRDRAQDIVAIRNLMGDDRYDGATLVSSGAAPDFIIGPKVKGADGTERVEIPDEWKRTVRTYRSVQTIGALCQRYEFDVYPHPQAPERNEVVNVRLVNASKGEGCETGASLAQDGIFKPEASDERIRSYSAALFARATETIEGKDLTLKVTPPGPGGEPDRYLFSWEDNAYKVPEAFSANPAHPTIRFSISKGGILLSYQNSAPLFATAYRSEQLTLEGTYVCLPKNGRDAYDPADGECQYGLQTDKGTLYALDFNVINPALKLGDRFRASGTFTPVETFSTDFWRNYAIRGVFSVKPPIVKR